MLITELAAGMSYGLGKLTITVCSVYPSLLFQGGVPTAQMASMSLTTVSKYYNIVHLTCINVRKM